MKWDSVHSESHVPFLPALISQNFTCIGILLFEEGKSIFYKLFFGFFSAFILNYVTTPVWNKFSFLYVSGMKDSLMSKPKKVFFPTKSKSFLRLILGSFFTFLSNLLFLYSRGNSAISNCMIFIFLKLLLGSMSGNIKTTKMGKFISCIFFFSSILIVAVSSKMKIIYLLFSFFSSWLSSSYIKLLIPSYHSETSTIPPLLLLSSIFSLVCGFFIEGFTFNFSLWKIIIAGCFIWSTPNFFILMKKNINEKLIMASFTIFPFIFTLILHFSLLKNSQLPLSIYMSVILSFLGGRFFTFTIPEISVFRPFTTTRSIIHTFFSIYLVFHALYNYIMFHKTYHVFMYTESSYLIMNLVWSLSEFFYVIQRTSSEQFTYGYGRLSSIFSFSISTFSLLTDILIFTQIFQLKDQIKPIPIKYSIPTLFCHILIIIFFIWSPKSFQKNRTQSIRNAINLNSAPPLIERHPEPNINSLSIDIGCFFLAFLDVFTNNFLIDRLISVLMLVLITYLIVPILKQSLSILLQSTPSHIQPCYSALQNEIRQCPCVTEITYMNFWLNDAALTIATIRVKIDEKQCPKPQEFLLFIISLCHQVGVLDVTVEIINNNEEVIISMATHNPYRRNSTIL